MPSVLLSLSTFVILTVIWESSQSSRQVVLTCGSDEGGEKGDAGAPGKRGPVGLIGPQGLKGDRGEEGECRNCKGAIEKLQEKIVQLENQLIQNMEQAVLISGRRNCQDVFGEGKSTSGLYNISIANMIVEVYCDMEADGGGWLVIQRRTDGSVDFYRDWETYQRGFGDKSGEYWLGLANIFYLTNSASYELRIELEDFDNERRFAKYSVFSIGSSEENYRLRISGYSGDAGHDAMIHHNNQPFSTRDRDHSLDGNCAIAAHGAWWYVSCFDSNLNGEYLRGQASSIRATAWGGSFRGHTYSMKSVQMKIRPKS